MCPVQAFRQFLADSGRDGTIGRLFGRSDGTSISPSSFGKVLQAHCAQLKLPYAGSATSQGFRRGTAQAIVRDGGTLSQLLEAGGWRSSAFLSYLERDELDSLAVYDLFEAWVDDGATPGSAALVPASRSSASSLKGLQDIRGFLQPAPVVPVERATPSALALEDLPLLDLGD